MKDGNCLPAMGVVCLSPQIVFLVMENAFTNWFFNIDNSSTLSDASVTIPIPVSV